MTGGTHCVILTTGVNHLSGQRGDAGKGIDTRQASHTRRGYHTSRGRYTSRELLR